MFRATGTWGQTFSPSSLFDSGSDLGSIWQGASRSFCLQGKYSLPPVLLHNQPRCTLGHGRASAPMARRAPECISPVEMIFPVLKRMRWQSFSLILVALWWPARSWYPETISLLAASPWQLPLRRNLLSQAGGEVVHLRPDLWRLHV